MTAMNDATRAQVTAARPDHSTWLSANAGSGKTRVLTDRVARLLLDEVQPQHILCLTYTKAAASEMQNRLFKRLGHWAMLGDDDLREQLLELGVSGSIPAQKLSQARQLFARAIETPGGLKIQTIHSFCAALLRRFPLEAQVSPQFTEMDDRAAALLREEIVGEMAEDGETQEAVAAIATYFTGDSLEDLSGEIARNAAGFARPLSFDDALALFDLPAGFDEAALRSEVFLGDESDILAALRPALMAGTSTDQKNADRLAPITTPGMADLPTLESVFLTGAAAKEPFTAKFGSFPTKKTQAALGATLPRLEDFMARVETARPRRLSLSAARRAHALHGFGRAFLDRYEFHKQQRGWLDFDDLINLARSLLTETLVAQWVLYRLDGGIDHILVDEAQDTSPAQWAVIEKLAQEFTSGLGARQVERTIFVVGDKKQSIYSFQGADPSEFDRMQREFGARLRETEHPLQVSELEFSFRSSHAVLSLVDRTFEGREKAGFSPAQRHRAFYADLPGRVDLWPVVVKEDKVENTDWHDPVDLTGPDHHTAILARHIAGEIQRMLTENVQLPVKQSLNGVYTSRLVTAGDFLILVQRRGPLFEAIIRECKALGLPMAGADRLRVGAELAVRDLAALLSFLATPEDDLSLATVLRSPLFGWSEQRLYTLAHGRAGYLWEALRDAAADHPETLAVLDDLRRQLDFLRPYDLIERTLTRHHGRKNLLARLGQEAEDGIDALLAQALAYERNAVPSLTGFLVWLETDSLEIKRQMESAGDKIRVMTVHGSKGLEAPIVILPDTGARRVDIKDSLIDRDGTALWKPPSDQTPPVVAEVLDAMKTRQQEERDRLLYVAMTRAEKWLIIAASGDLGNDGEAWHDRVRVAMEAEGALPHPMPTGQGQRLEHGNWAMSETESKDAPRAAPPTLDAHFLRPAPIPDPRPKPLSPSDLGGAKALPGEAGLDEDAAKRRGRQIHRLLEFLPNHPEPDWPDTAARILENGKDAATGPELDLLLQEAREVLTRPGLAHVFDPDTLAEVPLTAALPDLDGRRIHGVIDRLIVTDTTVTAVDFKTNAAVPETPQQIPVGILRQMAAYASALTQIFPNHRIDTAILWTRNATLMPLPHDIVVAALQNPNI